MVLREISATRCGWGWARGLKSGGGKSAGAGRGADVTPSGCRGWADSLGGVGKRADDGGGSGDAALQGEPGDAVRERRVDAPDGATARPGGKPQSPVAAAHTLRQGACPLCRPATKGLKELINHVRQRA